MILFNYGEPFYNPETVKEGYGSVQVGSGSDPWWDFAGYRDVKVDRWTKKCTLCGHEIITPSFYKQTFSYTQSLCTSVVFLIVFL